MAAIYRDLTADDQRIRQITADVADAVGRGRHCLVLTQWVAHLHNLAEALQAMDYDPVVLRGGMGTKTRAAAMSRLQLQPMRLIWEQEAAGSDPAIPTRFFECVVGLCKQVATRRQLLPDAGRRGWVSVHVGSPAVEGYGSAQLVELQFS